ncbi:cellulose binding domain-containing protein [Glycomyces tenuis]|uniref:cellulose binding domain-containing protein n=1 Tax=Glycomyces tenuis TaxID=58116 RepID=UPI00042419BE|nr:cellulose binding domain-containing protein [Glycomyces tenuis]
MRAWKDRTPLLRGRLHGRLLIVLGVVAALAVAVAVWQFSTALGGGEGQGASDDWAGPAADHDGASVAPLEEDSSAAAPTSASTSPTVEATSETPEETPSEETDEEPSEEDDTGPAGPSCTAALRLADEWSDSISVEVTVVNTGEEAVGGWEIVLDIDGVEVTSTWGMSRIEGDRYGNGLFNGALDPGEDAGPSFRADTEGEPELPGTVPCTAVP